MAIGIFVLLIVLLIVVHECGHFFAAKLFGIKVEEFGIGFPPRLWGKRLGETVYSLNWLFFGGFVRIHGESGEDAHSKRSFSGRSRWVQSGVIVSGVLCNLLFAWGALSVGYAVGLPTVLTPENEAQLSNRYVGVVGVLPDSPAERAGFRAGDRLERITASGEEVIGADASAVTAFVSGHEEPLAITVRRGNTDVHLSAQTEAGIVESGKALGVALQDFGTLKLPAGEAIVRGALLTAVMTRDTAEGLAAFIAGVVTGNADFSGVAGPVGIAAIGGSAVEEGFISALFLIAIISINLALINTLPIPGLDGGRLLVIMIEGVVGRALPKRAALTLTLCGLGFIAVVIVAVTYHDIARLIG